MKRTFAALAVLMMLLLTACGGSSPTSTSASASASKSMTDSLIGTYVGKNGSVLTLFPDGTSEYYYMLYSSMDYDKGAGSWNYKDGTLTWMYKDKPVTATINEQSALSFTLEQADGWNREQFIKASDSAKNRSVDEYQDLLRNTLNRPEMDNYDAELNRTYTLGSFDFMIPFYWFTGEKDESGIEFYAESTENDIACLAIKIVDIDADISNTNFEENGVAWWKDAASSAGTIVQEPSRIEVNGYPGVQGISSIANNGGYVIQDIIILLFDENSDSVLAIQLVTTDGTIFKYDSDFTKIVNSIKLSGGSSITQGTGRSENSSSSSNATSKSNSSGVTPELKEFLDSYEAFMNQYIAFMQKYESSNDPYAMISDYLNMMQQYADFAEKIDKYDTDKMSAADSAYYLEVTTRIAKKLYAVAIQ